VPVDRDEYRRASLESWRRMAPGWERRRASIDDMARPVREWLIRQLAPQPGETILELAAGPGSTGFVAAELLGDDGRLISSDFAPEMVEVARRRGAELGLDNVEYRVLDAERLDLDDDSVDGAICRFGLMLMADPAAALAEARRVLRPGGRLVFAAWRGPEQNPWVSLAGRVLVTRGHMAPPDPEGPGMSALASHQRVRSLLGDAGFTDVLIEDVPLLLVWSDVDDYVATTRDTGRAFATAFAEASEEEQAALTREIAQAFAPFAVDGGYELPGLALVAVAR
jgi:SAM-dependent methyltransferase